MKTRHIKFKKSLLLTLTESIKKRLETKGVKKKDNHWIPVFTGMT